MKVIIAILIGLTLGVILGEYDIYLKDQDHVYYDYYIHKNKPPVTLLSILKG